MNMYENTQTDAYTNIGNNTYTDIGNGLVQNNNSGLIILNTCPHGLNLIREEAEHQDRRSRKYELREKYCQNLADATLHYIPRGSFVLSVNEVEVPPRQSDIPNDTIPYYDSDAGFMNFNRDISAKAGNGADIIVISEKCASLLRAKLFCCHAGIQTLPLVLSKMNGLLGGNVNGAVNLVTWADAMIFLDKFYVPKYQVFRGKNVVGTLGLQKVLPPLDMRVFLIAADNGLIESISRVGLNRAMLSLYEQAQAVNQPLDYYTQMYTQMKYNVTKDLLENYFHIPDVFPNYFTIPQSVQNPPWFYDPRLAISVIYPDLKNIRI